MLYLVDLWHRVAAHAACYLAQWGCVRAVRVSLMDGKPDLPVPDNRKHPEGGDEDHDSPHEVVGINLLAPTIK
jgi:hypothetical protein